MFSSKSDNGVDSILSFMRAEFAKFDERQKGIVTTLKEHKLEVHDEITELKRDLKHDLLSQYTSKLEHQASCSSVQQSMDNKFIHKAELKGIKEIFIAESCDRFQEKFAKKEVLASLRREIYIAVTAVVTTVTAAAWAIDHL